MFDCRLVRQLHIRAIGLAILLVITGVAGEQALGKDLAQRKPIVFFVAKGAIDSCGKGCSQWIAAEGRFDPDALQRFREFISELPRRELPVFFNSHGGNVRCGAGKLDATATPASAVSGGR